MKEKTMLIADDSLISRTLLHEIFQDDFIIYEAMDGQQTLDIMRQHHGNITILILDLMMPNKTGYDVLQEMKKDPVISEIPVIVVTALTDVVNEIKVLDYGAADIIAKPFDPRVITYRVNNIVQKLELTEVKLENAVLRSQNQAQIQLKAIMDNMSGGVILLEIQNNLIPHLLYCNNGFYKMSAYTPEDITQKNINVASRFYDKDRKKLSKVIEKAIETSNPFIHVCRAYNAKDEMIWVQLQGVRINYEDSNYPVLLVIVSDITKEKEMTDELNEKTLHLTALINNMPGGVSIFECRSDGVVISYVNDTLAQICGYTSDEYKALFASDFSLALHPDDVRTFFHNIKDGVLSNSPVNNVVRQLCKDGNWKWFKIISTPIYATEDCTTMYSLYLDYSSEHLKEEKIEKATNELLRRANYDDLTGIFNRVAFCEYTRRIFQDNPDEDFCILVINIRGFKLINDVFGEAFGNSILQRIAEMLMNGEISSDAYCRLQADHFAICVKEKNFDKKAIINTIYQGLSHFSIIYDIKIAVGIYYAHDRDVPVSNMCDRANLALQYGHEVSDGEDCFVYDDEIRSLLMNEQNILSQIEIALEEHQFIIHLQPVYDLSKEEIAGAEVLVRWNHPTEGFIAPGKFIPILERHGYISRLDRYVWEETCKYLQKRRQNNLMEIPLSVNASRASIINIDITRIMKELTNKYDIEPSLLRIEITESLYADNPRLLHTRIKELQNAGFVVLMDDFGSGYSSFNALKDLDVSILKIDMNFLYGVENNDRASTILASIVRMTKWLGMPIIAEGVETQTQADFLKSIGCYLMQGYYFSKPLATDAFEKLPQFQGIKKSAILPDEYKYDGINSIFTANPILVKLFNEANCAAGIFEYHNGKLEVMRVNEAYYKITGYDADTIYTYAANAHDAVFHEDVHISENACEEVLRTHGTTNAIIRRKHYHGGIIWIDIKYTYFGSSDNENLIYITFYDITHEKEEANLLSVTSNVDDIMPNLPVGIIIYEIVNKEFIIRFCTNRAKSIVGITQQEYLKEHLNKASNVVKFNEDENDISKSLETKKPIEVVSSVTKKDGTVIWLRMVRSFMKNENSILCYMTLMDITDKVLEEHQKNKQDEIYKMILDSSQALIFDYDCDTDALDYSIYFPEQGRKYTNIPNYSEYIKTTPTVFEEDRALYCKTFFKESRKNSKGSFEFRANFYNNGFRWYRCHYISLFDKGNIYRIIGRAYIIQGEVRAREKLLSRLSTDDLSGLVNHSTTKKLIDKKFKFIDETTKCAFFMIDIDNFKSINDTYGHPVGDMVIKELAKNLNSVFRKEDIISRLSGDEFSVLCDIETIEAAESRAKQLLEVVGNICIPSKPDLKVSISIGIAFAPRHGRQFAKLFAAADSALYEAKHKGKNCYAIFNK